MTLLARIRALPLARATVSASASDFFFAGVSGFPPADRPGAQQPSPCAPGHLTRAQRNTVAFKRADNCSSELNRFGELAFAVFSALAGAFVSQLLRRVSHGFKPSESCDGKVLQVVGACRNE